jgi:CheY-like chemotaxis protein
MRPRKTILFVTDNEDRRGRRRFLLDTWGYRAIGVESPGDALRELRTLAHVDVLLVWMPLDHEATQELLTRTAKRKETCSMVILKSGPPPENCVADSFLPESRSSPAEMRYWLDLICRRKRGPKTGVKKPVQKVSAAALAELQMRSQSA